MSVVPGTHAGGVFLPSICPIRERPGASPCPACVGWAAAGRAHGPAAGAGARIGSTSSIGAYFDAVVNSGRRP